MRTFCAAAVIALLAGPAYAQATHVPRYGESDPDKSLEQIQADKAANRAYQRSLGNIPDQGPTDPWGNARGTDAPKSAAAPKPAKPAPAKTAKTAPKPGVTTN
jgi:hypothetical protein